MAEITEHVKYLMLSAVLCSLTSRTMHFVVRTRELMALLTTCICGNNYLQMQVSQFAYRKVLVLILFPLRKGKGHFCALIVKNNMLNFKGFKTINLELKCK